MAVDNNRRAVLKFSGAAIAGMTMAGCIGDDDDAPETAPGVDDDDDHDDGDDTEPEDHGAIQIYGIEEWEETAVGEQFTDDTGYEMETTILLAGENAARYIREYESDVHIPDIIQGFDENFSPLVEHDDTLIADPELPNKDEVYPEEYEQHLAEEILLDEEAASNIVPLMSFLSCFSYNPDITDEPPQSYEDLLEPRFEDDIIMLAYNVSGFYDQLWREHDEEYAEEFILALDEQNPDYVGESPLAALEMVGAGQAKVLPDSFVSHNLFFQEAGLSLDYSWGEHIWRHDWGAALTTSADREDQAREFLHFMASREGQELLSQLFGGTEPFHEDLPHGSPEAEERFAEEQPTVRPQSMPAERERYIEEEVLPELIGL